MSFKFQQVLRTKDVLTAVSGETIPAGTRVVVMDKATTGDPSHVRVKVEDTALPDLRKIRIQAAEDAFEMTFRGRPVVTEVTETAAE